MLRIASTTVFALCLAALCGLPLLGCMAEPEPEPFVCTQSHLDAIPACKAIQRFSLDATDGEGTAPAEATGNPDADASESAAEDEAVLQAIDNLYADCGFVAIDLSTGQGIAYNAGEALYGASTVKAAYCLFLCDEYLDPGTIADTDYAPGFYGIDQACPHLDSWPNAGCVGNLMECALINSDNSAYESLRYPYDQTFQAWLEGLDAAPTIDPNRTWYPSFTATQEAHIWLHLRDYLASDAPHAAWLGETMQQATVSFIKDVELPEDAVVESKAG